MCFVGFSLLFDCWKVDVEVFGVCDVGRSWQVFGCNITWVLCSLDTFDIYCVIKVRLPDSVMTNVNAPRVLVHVWLGGNMLCCLIIGVQLRLYLGVAIEL